MVRSYFDRVGAGAIAKRFRIDAVIARHRAIATRRLRRVRWRPLHILRGPLGAIESNSAVPNPDESQ